MKQSFVLFLLLILALPSNLVYAQKQQHFYNLDKEIKVEGTVQEIIMEPRYKDSAPFLIIILDEKKNKQRYRIEVSPTWFFDHDLHKGENMVVLGSLYTTGENDLNIIAKEIRFSGENLVLRDKHGFPNWRGGKMGRRGKKKGQRF